MQETKSNEPGPKNGTCPSNWDVAMPILNKLGTSIKRRESILTTAQLGQLSKARNKLARCNSINPTNLTYQRRIGHQDCGLIICPPCCEKRLNYEFARTSAALSRLSSDGSRVLSTSIFLPARPANSLAQEMSALQEIYSRFVNSESRFRETFPDFLAVFELERSNCWRPHFHVLLRVSETHRQLSDNAIQKMVSMRIKEAAAPVRPLLIAEAKMLLLRTLEDIEKASAYLAKGCFAAREEGNKRIDQLSIAELEQVVESMHRFRKYRSSPGWTELSLPEVDPMIDV